MTLHEFNDLSISCSSLPSILGALRLIETPVRYLRQTDPVTVSASSITVTTCNSDFYLNLTGTRKYESTLSLNPNLVDCLPRSSPQVWEDRRSPLWPEGTNRKYHPLTCRFGVCFFPGAVPFFQV